MSVEDKISQIMAEHEADERGLLQNRNKFADELKSAKETIKSFDGERETFNTKIKELEETLKKTSTDNTASKEYWQAQYDSQLKAKDADYAKLNEQFVGLKSSYYSKLRNEAVNEAVKEYSFIDGLKGGFIASLLYNNTFEPKDIDGEIIFLNKNNKTISEVAKDFALTNEGKAYLKNPSAGGGARSGNTSNSRVNTMTRSEFEQINRTNPSQAREFLSKGGQILDN